MSIDISYEEKTNMFQTWNSFTQIEDLSNEIFYEIFEYIECYDLFQGFENLNNRFENLLNNPCFSLKINLSSESISEVRNYYTQFIIPNKHRIVSLSLNDRSDILISKSSLYIIDASFNRLESLVLNRVRHRELVSFFPVLSSLPRLFAIAIHLDDSFLDLTKIYHLIFLLSYLKKIELSSKGYLLVMPLSMNTSEQYNHIQRLIINHTCNLTELIALLSYTPLLVHLTCMELIKQGQEILPVISIKMIHLTSMTFNMCHAQFDTIEIFIEKLCKCLRVLCINASEDVTYLDAPRWERLIVQHMPYLRVFKFEYHEWHYQSVELTSFHNLLNQFTSVFWINCGWFFQITADIDYWPPIKIIYSIRPDRKKSSQVHEQAADIKLTVDRLYFATCRQNLADVFFCFINKFHITHLDIDCRKLLYLKFIKLLCLLPNLNSLGILSLSSFKMKCLSQEEIKFVESWSRNNKITKLIVKSFSENSDLDKIQFFVNLNPQLEYLKVKCENNFNMKSIVRYILIKNVDKFLYFNLFCLWVPIANDDIVNQLQIMINSEKLLYNYRITRTTDRMYLQWKVTDGST